MTGPVSRRLVPAPWLRLPRPTARLRLTVLYGTMLTFAGTGLLAFTYWLFDRATAGERILPNLGPGTHGCLRKDLACVHQYQGALRAHELDLHALLVESGIALAVMAALSFALGWLIAGRVLRPVRAITATARRVSAASLHERLSVAGPDDEFKELADAFNGLLARLESAFTSQRNFVASASHELRTPLTLDRTLLEVTLRSPKATIEKWRDVAGDLLESGRQQERILEALLTLATSEAGLSRLEPADLSEAAAVGLRNARSQIEQRRLRVQASLGPAPLLGDPDLIERLIVNLIDNAVRHNIPGGTVDVTADTRHGHAVLTVANTGPAIPLADIDRLYQPFQRLAARASDGDGDSHGLGLSIVAAIAAAHGAALTTRARPHGGLHIQVSFPAADSLPRPRAGARQDLEVKAYRSALADR